MTLPVLGAHPASSAHTTGNNAGTSTTVHTQNHAVDSVTRFRNARFTRAAATTTTAPPTMIMIAASSSALPLRNGEATEPQTRAPRSS